MVDGISGHVVNCITVGNLDIAVMRNMGRSNDNLKWLAALCAAN